MKTIHKLGDSMEIAGTPTKPTTTRIPACPKCYGEIRWMRESQTSACCELCGQEYRFAYYPGLTYERTHVSFLHPLRSILLILWLCVQWIDSKFRLRKNLMYAILKILSWLP